MKRFNRFYSSFILLIIGGILLKTLFYRGEECGSPNSWLVFILVVAYIFVLVLAMINILIRLTRKKEKFNFYPIITTLILGSLLAFFSVAPEDLFASKTLLKAELSNDNIHHEYSLTLRADNTFKVVIKDEQNNCRFTGNYTLQNDTLNLLRPELQTISNDLFGPQYHLNSVTETLYPINNLGAPIDSSKYLKIVVDNRK